MNFEQLEARQLMATIPNDTFFSQQWALQNTGQVITPTFPPNLGNVDFGIAGADIGATEAWDVTTGDPTQVVAIFGSGTDVFHPDLRPNLWRNPGEIPDNVDNDGNGFIDDIYGYNFASQVGDVSDIANGFGTREAGIIAGVGNNGIGTTGVSWSTKIMTLKGGGNTQTATSFVNAVNYALDMKVNHGVNIVAFYDGYVSTTTGPAGFSFAEYDAIQRLNDFGITFVAFSGETNNNSDVTNVYPPNYLLPNVIVAGGTTNDDVFAAPSNYGLASVDLFAPSTNILAPTSNLTPLGANVVTETVNGVTAKYSYLFNTTGNSAAYVTGAVALLKAANPDLTPAQIRQLLISSSDALPTLDGRGLGGRLNIGAAMNLLPAAVLSGTVYVDANNSGGRDLGESGLAGERLYIDLNNNSVLDAGEPNTLSAADGSYSLRYTKSSGANLKVRQVADPSYIAKQGATGYSRTVQVPSVTTGLDFGNALPAGQVSGRVISDLNKNGVLDSGELGANHVLVYVDLHADGQFNVGEPAAYTDANGNYVIGNVPPGTYSVRLGTTPGWEASIIDPANPAVLGQRTETIVRATTTPNVDFFVLPVFDWGDSPDSFNFTAAGVYAPPVHSILPNFYIGTPTGPGVDAESGPQISTDASGDSAGVDDESFTDVIFDELVAGSPANVQVQVTVGTNPRGYLQGWIDFNRDGTFSANEQIITDARVGTGAFNQRFQVPSSFQLGTHIARFRLSLQKGVGSTGFAPGGEVLDTEVRVFGVAPQPQNDSFQVNQNSVQTDPENSFHVLANDTPSKTGLPQISFVGGVPQIGASATTLGVLKTANGGDLFYNNNGTPLDRTDDFIQYKPPTGFQPDKFFYQIEDPQGHVSSLLGEVDITILPGAPVARDDTFSIPPAPTTASITVLDVLANDLQRGALATGGGNITIVAGSLSAIPASVGTLSIRAKSNPANTSGHDEILFSRNPAYTGGSFQFTYRMNDTRPGFAVAAPFPQAQVTVQVFPTGTPNPPTTVPPGAEVRIRSQIVDASGTPLLDPKPGDTIYVQLLVQDLRTPNNFNGIITVGADLGYNPSVVQPVADPTDPSGNRISVTYGAGFQADPNNTGNLTDQFSIAPGLLNEISAVYFGDVTTLNVGGNHAMEQLLCTITFQVLPTAATGATASFVLDPADDLNHGVFHYASADFVNSVTQVPTANVFYTGVNFDIDSAVPVATVLNTLTVKDPAAPEGEYTNPTNAADVNADKKVNISDVLAVIGDLRKDGPRDLMPVNYVLLTTGLSGLPNSFSDANRDGRLDISDALSVLSYMRFVKNSLNASSGEGEGSAATTSIVTTSVATGAEGESTATAVASSAEGESSATPASQAALATDLALADLWNSTGRKSTSASPFGEGDDELLY